MEKGRYFFKEDKQMDNIKEVTKEATDLVDTVFDDPAEFKSANRVNEANEMVDNLLDDCGKDHSVKEVENKIENAPTEDPEEEADRVRDDIAGEDEVTPGGEDESAIEGAVNAIDNMLKLNEATAYQKFFQARLKKWGVSSPAQLPADKKKQFFNMIDKEWKGKKEAD